MTPALDFKAQYAAFISRIAERMQRVLVLVPQVAGLKARLATYNCAKHCIVVASGTGPLMARDLKPGDDVITTPFTFAATAERDRTVDRHRHRRLPLPLAGEGWGEGRVPPTLIAEARPTTQSP